MKSYLDQLGTLKNGHLERVLRNAHLSAWHETPADLMESAWVVVAFPLSHGTFATPF